MPVTIKNLTKSPITFLLTRPEHRERSVVQRYNYDPKTGSRYTHRRRISLGGSVTILAKETRGNLPDTYRFEKEIINAAEARPKPKIKLSFAEDVKAPQAAKAPAAAPLAPPALSASSSRKSKGGRKAAQTPNEAKPAKE